MSILEELGFPIEIYSVDEAFLQLPEKLPCLKEIRARVLQWTGIPISIGVGATKTLAKVANHIAKGREEGIFTEPESELAHFPLKEVWGIGSQTALALSRFGITTVEELINCDEIWLQNHFSIALVRTQRELRGTPNFKLEEEPSPKQSIVCSRSFGRLITKLDALKEAVATFTAMAAEKARAQDSLAAHLGLFIIGKDRRAHFASQVLATPSAYTPDLIAKAHHLLETLYNPADAYRKAGVTFSHLVPEEEVQLDLFENSRSLNLMRFIDTLNRKKRTLFFASEGTACTWKPAAGKRSPPFTTDWACLPVVR